MLQCLVCCNLTGNDVRFVFRIFAWASKGDSSVRWFFRSLHPIQDRKKGSKFFSFCYNIFWFRQDLTQLGRKANTQSNIFLVWSEKPSHATVHLIPTFSTWVRGFVFIVQLLYDNKIFSFDNCPYLACYETTTKIFPIGNNMKGSILFK